jgi:hypothetical protein
MEYEHYLFSNLWKLRNKKFKNMPYDLQYGLIFVEYDKFLKSKFAHLDTSLYDCIDLYFADKYLINPLKQ